MPAPPSKSLLVIVRCTPYGNSLARTSLEVALSGAIYNQTVALLFLGEGVLQLLPEQDSGQLCVRNISKLIASFPLYELETIFADNLALENYGIEKSVLPENISLLGNEAMAQLMCDYDHILGF